MTITLLGPPAIAAEQQTLRPFAGLEWLKLTASIGIVVFHLGLPYAHVGYAGLPIFVMLTVAMASKSAAVRAWPEFRRGRVQRLLLPWLFWSLVYALVQCLMASMQSRPVWSWLHWSVPLIGGYPHLWYLPFAAAVTLLVGRTQCGRRRRNQARAWPWFVGGALLMPLCSRGMLQALPMPLPQWLFVTPAVLFGIGLGTTPIAHQAARKSLTYLLAICLAGCGVCWLLGLQEMIEPYSLGALATVFAWCMPWRITPGQQWFTRTSFGIYLLHHLTFLLLALTMATFRLALPPFAVLMLTVGLAIAATAALLATRMRRFL